ncbi:hypothetical protein LDK02_06460 [Fusobacterium animalis]|jgi:hypothetical protein|nr:hypothetical protein [Fusobacterium animalis]
MKKEKTITRDRVGGKLNILVNPILDKRQYIKIKIDLENILNPEIFKG